MVASQVLPREYVQCSRSLCRVSVVRFLCITCAVGLSAIILFCLSVCRTRLHNNKGHFELSWLTHRCSSAPWNVAFDRFMPPLVEAQGLSQACAVCRQNMRPAWSRSEQRWKG